MILQYCLLVIALSLPLIVCAQNYESLTLWLQENNSSVPVALSLVLDEHGYRDIISLYPITYSSTLMMISPQNYISLQTAYSSEIGRLLQENNIPFSLHFQNLIMVMFFLQEYKKQNRSYYFPYLSLFPPVASIYSFPCMWPENYLKLLPPATHREIQVQEQRIVQDYQLVQRLASKLEFSISIKEFHWGFLMVGSRAFDVTTENSTDTLLVPLADLLNHQARTNLHSISPVSWILNSSVLIMFTNIDIPANSTVWGYYGAKSSAELLIHYGFVPPINYDDTTVLVLDFSPFRWVTQQFNTRMKLIDALITDSPEMFPCSIVDRTSLALECPLWFEPNANSISTVFWILRILFAESPALPQVLLVFNSEIDKVIHIPSISFESEMQTYNTLRHLLEDHESDLQVRLIGISSMAPVESVTMELHKIATGSIHRLLSGELVIIKQTLTLINHLITELIQSWLHHPWYKQVMKWNWQGFADKLHTVH